MEFPDEARVSAVLDPVEFPPFHEVRYDPPTPELEDVPGATREAVDALPARNLPEGATVAVGVGSRGITDLVPVVGAVVARLRDRDLDPVVVPAMGSHGGATAEGQRGVLEAMGVTEESVGAPIDPRMETVVLGESEMGSPVHFSEVALEADATMVVNRVKAHTNFTGSFESGLIKMTTVGLGKQVGASAIHEQALVEGYVPVIESALEVIRSEVPLLGGVAVVENFEDETAEIEGVPAGDLPGAEAALLERASEYMPTLPYEDLDVLVVERIGKDVSGAGMDTNVIGRYQVLNAEEPETPRVRRILVLGLTEATHGNGQGIGLADLTTVDVVEELDLDQVYANALTSSSFSKARLPIALPTDELALAAAVSGAGPYDPEEARVAWIRDTGHLSEFRVSPALARDPPEHVEVVGRSRLTFENGTAGFEPME
ncbi:MAG: DUF2088 family protein of unknown function [uncultured archaeon A07HR67]|nr:MAG: DUF2088 family protein of unknown function [uncultured archaeon A07HR67]